ncbi:MAG: enoyl-[acyl-carrier-protein] reductase FabL [Candidatus Sericytochromatia bacterium]|nr:enoyl-[acyl-carrier-protein] reductase FabL [Candidatus Sericytochromatia bacterium]
MDLNLNGKTALITGGSRGIGKAIALALAQQGVQVFLNYLRNKKAAEAAADEIEAASGQRPLLFKANVGDQEKVQALITELKEHTDQIDFLISNAASGVLKPGLELTRRHLEWTFEINTYALLFLVQAARPLLPQGARVLAISSQGASHVIPDYAAVGASKAALESLVRHLSVELAPEGLHINAISAGVVDTDALKHFPAREQLISNAASRTPAGRLTTPEDVANVALFLCSDLAEMIHGQTLVVDGGYRILA